MEGLGEEACQVEEDQTLEHRCQVVAACRGEVEEAQAYQGAAEPEVLSPSVPEEEVPWGAVQTAAEERRTEVDHHQVLEEQIVRVASEEADPWPWGEERIALASAPVGA